MSTIVTLRNGKRVANFSSPHPFQFTDGTILPSVTYEEAERLKVTFHESVDSDGDVSLSFSISDDVHEEMLYWLDMYKSGNVDVVFIPLPMMTAIKDPYFSIRKGDMDIKHSPFRCVRIEDRINKLVSINKQCI